MIRLALAGHETGHRWQWQGGRWRLAHGWVEPYDHPALETWCVTDGRRSLLVVRERMAGVPRRPARLDDVTARQFDRELAAAARWPLDGMTLYSTPESGYRLTAGRWGSAPVYLSWYTGMLHGSWDIADLYPAMSAVTLDTSAVARRLAGEFRYGSGTLFCGVHRLTERATATFTTGGLDLTYPQPAAVHAPREIAPDADPVAAFDQILSASVHRGPARADEVAVEVSGGYDSAMVLVSAVDAFGPASVTTAGLLITGPAAEQQRRRRRALIEGAAPGLPAPQDETLPATAALPFCPGGRRQRGERFSPDEEPYGEMLELLLGKLVASGRRTVLTGMGGDELMRVPGHGGPSPRPPYGVLTSWGREMLEAAPRRAAPRTVIPESALHANLCRAPLFLRAGAWPVSPLCTPELVRFCEWLPPRWRIGKRLPGLLLERHGYPAEVVHPRIPEDFGQVMRLALRRYVLEPFTRTLDDSVLVGLGLVDPDALRKLLDEAELPFLLYEVANLDLALRSLLR